MHTVFLVMCAFLSPVSPGSCLCSVYRWAFHWLTSRLLQLWFSVRPQTQHLLLCTPFTFWLLFTANVNESWEGTREERRWRGRDYRRLTSFSIGQISCSIRGLCGRARPPDWIWALARCCARSQLRSAVAAVLTSGSLRGACDLTEYVERERETDEGMEGEKKFSLLLEIKSHRIFITLQGYQRQNKYVARADFHHVPQSDVYLSHLFFNVHI